MSEQDILELASLAALGVLDGEDQRAFEARAATGPELRRELLSFERVVGQLGLATAPIEPSAGVRHRVLAAAAPTRAGRPSEGRAATARRRLQPALALAAALVLGVGLFLVRGQRDAARREAARSEAEARSLTLQVQDAQRRVEALALQLADANAFRELVAHPASRVANLGGLAAAPAARARVVWNAERLQAVLLTSGLPPAPAGKAYEAWVIAAAAPRAAGIFKVDARGQAVHALPGVEEIARARTFAVTLEPESGTPAPTGPMVLAGPAL